MNYGPLSHSYYSQRLKLRYVEWGQKDAPVLLMVHGMRDHCRNWDWVAKEFSQDYRIIAPDLRGHGDSDWAIGSSYSMIDFVADITQLVHQTTKPDEKITLMCHSFGGSVGLYYAGLYPEKIDKAVVIEGLGPPLKMIELYGKTPIERKLSEWIESLRKTSARTSKKYESLDAAIKRMHEENSHLSYEQAKHLSVHGLNQNEDGTYTWKFDNYLRVMAPTRISQEDSKTLWGRIEAPILMCRGANSWAEPHESDKRLEAFKNIETLTIDNAGHWLHHDQLDIFVEKSKAFLAK